MNGLTLTDETFDLGQPVECEFCGVTTPGTEPHKAKCPFERAEKMRKLDTELQESPAERSAKSRAKRIEAAGFERVEVMLAPKVAEKLQKLAELHGSRRAAIEAAILAL